MFKMGTLLAVGLLSQKGFSQLQVGQPAPIVEIAGESGSRIDGSPWSSGSIKDKVYSLFYVDPDEKGANEELEGALKKEEFDKSKYGSIAVINLAATWKPNMIIEKILAGKQKEYPDTIYVKDKSSVLVKQWKLADNAYVVMLFDKSGKLLFNKAGSFSAKDIADYIAAIKSNM
jgi:predicted transcriptional regulator